MSFSSNSGNGLKLKKRENIYRNYADECGRCSRCKEYTSLFSPCCGSTVEFEGGEFDAYDLVNDIADELGVEADDVCNALD